MRHMIALLLALAVLSFPALCAANASAATWKSPLPATVTDPSQKFAGMTPAEDPLPDYDPYAADSDTSSKAYAALMYEFAAQLRGYDGSNAEGFTVTLQIPFTLQTLDHHAFFDDLFLHTIREFPEFFWVNLGSRHHSYDENANTVTYAISIFPEFQGDGFAGAKSAFDKAVDDVVSQIFRPDMSDMEKVLSAYGWIKQYVKYDSAAGWDAYSAYSALVNRSAVCHGCAVTFNLLLQKAGVGCYTVLSHVENDSMYHIWNAVQVNGSWYNLDPTAGHIPGYLSYEKFMRCTQDMLNGGSYFEHVTRMHVACDQVYQNDTPWRTTSNTFLYSEKYQSLVNVENCIISNGITYLGKSATYRMVSISEDGTVTSTPIATIPGTVRCCTQEYKDYLYYLTYDGKLRAYCISTGNVKDMSSRSHKDSYLYLDAAEEILVIADGMGNAKETFSLLP